MADQLGSDAADLAYVGHSPTDLEAARDAGALAVAAAWGHLYDPDARADDAMTNPFEVLTLL